MCVWYVHMCVHVVHVRVCAPVCVLVHVHVYVCLGIDVRGLSHLVSTGHVEVLPPSRIQSPLIRLV